MIVIVTHSLTGWEAELLLRHVDPDTIEIMRCLDGTLMAVIWTNDHQATRAQIAAATAERRAISHPAAPGVH